MQGNQLDKYTLLYVRLSNEDKREGTSLSIQHQEEMLQDYAEKQGFRNPLFLYDDGVSGIKTNRPGLLKAHRKRICVKPAWCWQRSAICSSICGSLARIRLCGHRWPSSRPEASESRRHMG